MGLENRKSVSVNEKAIIKKAFRRSLVRWKVVEYLFKINPSASYVSEIAYSIRATPTNVIGAIRGMGERYREEDSLLRLNIVEEVESRDNTKLYRLTEFGKEIVQMLMKEENRLSGE